MRDVGVLDPRNANFTDIYIVSPAVTVAADALTVPGSTPMGVSLLSLSRSEIQSSEESHEYRTFTHVEKWRVESRTVDRKSEKLLLWNTVRGGGGCAAYSSAPIRRPDVGSSRRTRHDCFVQVSLYPGRYTHSWLPSSHTTPIACAL